MIEKSDGRKKILENNFLNFYLTIGLKKCYVMLFIYELSPFPKRENCLEIVLNIYN